MSVYIQDFFEFLERNPTQFHIAQSTIDEATLKGCIPLAWEDEWKLEKGNRYAVKLPSSIVVLFSIPNKERKPSYNLIASHIDSPSIYLKPDPAFAFEKKFIKLNTEVYGGALLYTWFDRSLSIAGVVSYKKEGLISSQLIDCKEPIAVIPSTAIHLQKEIHTKGFSIDKQKDLLPLVAIAEENNINDYFYDVILKNYAIKKENVRDFMLCLYDTQKPSYFGLNKEFINASRLDNLALFYASYRAFLETEPTDNINILIGFDHEEIGSKSAHGADSVMASTIVERIAMGLGYSREDFLTMLSKASLYSLDVAHATHPNNPDKSDPQIKVGLNEGVVIKYNYSQKYGTDTQKTAGIIDLCISENIAYQKFVNHSEVGSGSTLGPYLSASLAVPCVEIGIPLLGMHSIRETAGVADCESSYKLCQCIFKGK